ncbi:hypothetical protein OUZ56_014436 [Daphnia magna]|uniref:Uncharacterized protein n=1 Tax=Daphnia magna TaxID=35525 RepID=A0ABR0AK54_9CRUS|nr:hypothetical protein OUZ56_014436 [Daphnia magna]
MLKTNFSKYSVRNRTFISQHALPMLNHRAMSHITELTVSLRHLRLQIQLAAVKNSSAKIGCHKLDNYDITTRA